MTFPKVYDYHICVMYQYCRNILETTESDGRYHESYPALME